MALKAAGEEAAGRWLQHDASKQVPPMSKTGVELQTKREELQTLIDAAEDAGDILVMCESEDEAVVEPPCMHELIGGFACIHGKLRANAYRASSQVMQSI